MMDAGVHPERVSVMEVAEGDFARPSSADVLLLGRASHMRVPGQDKVVQVESFLLSMSLANRSSGVEG